MISTYVMSQSKSKDCRTFNLPLPAGVQRGTIKVQNVSGIMAVYSTLPDMDLRLNLTVLQMQALFSIRQVSDQ
jgi:hypothetical protein